MTLKPTLYHALVGALFTISALLVYFLFSGHGQSLSDITDSSQSEARYAQFESGRFEDANANSTFANLNIRTASSTDVDRVLGHKPSLLDAEQSSAAESIDAIRSDLLTATPESLDVERLLRGLNRSHTLMQAAAELYRSSDDPKLRSLLFDVLNDSSHPAKIELAMQLAHSESVDERLAAYAWLENGAFTNENEMASTALVDAMFHEDHADALASLVWRLPLARLPIKADVFQRAVMRLNELSFHPNEDVASAAITQLSQTGASAQTLSILQLHLQDGSDGRQLAALTGLKNIKHSSEAIISSLHSIMNDPERSRRNRATAARVLIDYENRRANF